MPLAVSDLPSTQIHSTIRLLIHHLTSITDPTGEFLLRLPDGRVIDTKGWHDWEWTHGIGLYGIWQYYLLTADPSFLETIESWFSARFAAGGTSKNINTMAVFLTLAHVYEKTGNQTYVPWLDAWAEWAYWDLKRTRGGGMQHVTYLDENARQLWDDTLMMTVMPLAKIGQVLKRERYVEEAKRQFLIHVQYLFDRETGFFFHGWEFHDDVEGRDGGGGRGGGHNFAKARWARGNAWVTMVVPEFIELLDLKEQDPLRLFLVETLRAQVDALRRCQTESGLWCTLLDVKEDEGSYVEASATAGFAYGMLKAKRLRLVDGHGVGEAAERAIKGVLANVSEEGELRNVSFGTGMGDSLQFYKDIPRTSMPYGQAMAIMALTEWLRVYI